MRKFIISILTFFIIPAYLVLSQEDLPEEEREITPFERIVMSKEEPEEQVITTKIKKGVILVSFDVINYNITDLIYEICKIKKVNVIFSPKVKGTFTGKVKDEPIDEALKRILKTSGLDYEQIGNLIRIELETTLRAERKKQLDIFKASQETEPLITRTIYLNYAPLKEVEANLKPNLSPRGTILSNPQNKQLIITDIAERFQGIYELVKRLDIPPKQVLIEAKIIEILHGNFRDFGIFWQTSNYINPAANPKVEGGVNTPGTPQIGLSISTVNDMLSFNARLASLIYQDKLKVSSNPRIVTLNNKNAKINIGAKIPLRVQDEAGQLMTQLTYVGTIIDVTPQINAENRIVLKIKPEISSLGEALGAGVRIVTTEVTTNLILNDGQTAVIGGLIREETTAGKAGIPILKDIPLIGSLFSSTTKITTQREIMVLITPKILFD